MNLYLTVDAENQVIAAHVPPAPFPQPVDPPVPADDLPAVIGLARQLGVIEGGPPPADDPCEARPKRKR
jgi:hypothetical protein